MSKESKEWLDKNEWPDIPIDSSAYSHYTYLSDLMEQFAREYHQKQLIKFANDEKIKFKKYL
jgi:hypothetical protein|tara:strand:+ start:3330 stop:3515 length:186 start_codon:yes stop_codon:yes gene_type:complete